MTNLRHRLTEHVFAVLTLTVVLLGTLTSSARARRGGHPRDRGAVSLEQAILTAVLSAAAIGLGVIIVNAINARSGNIR